MLDLPQVLGGGTALDPTVHGPLEEDGADDALGGEGLRGDDAGAHGMDQIEHLGVVRIALGADPVARQGLGRGAPGLIERGDEARSVPHLLGLLLVHDGLL